MKIDILTLLSWVLLLPRGDTRKTNNHFYDNRGASPYLDNDYVPSIFPLNSAILDRNINVEKNNRILANNDLENDNDKLKISSKQKVKSILDILDDLNNKKFLKTKNLIGQKDVQTQNLNNTLKIGLENNEQIHWEDMNNVSSNVADANLFVAIPFNFIKQDKVIHVPKIIFEDIKESNYSHDFSDNPKLNLEILKERLPENKEMLDYDYPQYNTNREMTCSPGSKWTSFCYDCVCSTAGISACKKILGCVLRPYGEPMICKPFSTFKLDDCNTCECNGDGIPVCTFIDCNELPVNHNVLRTGVVQEAESKDLRENKETMRFAAPSLSKIYQETDVRNDQCHSLKDLKRCAPETKWRSSCYDCSCNQIGKRICFKNANCHLRKSDKVPQCKANLSFGTSCRPCVCSDEGEPNCFDTCLKKTY